MKPIESLTDEEVQLIYAHFEETPTGTHAQHTQLRDAVIVLLMLDAGLRVAEVAKTRVSAIVFNGQPCSGITVTSEAAKLHKERSVPLTFRLQKAILAYYIKTLWGYEEPNNTFAFEGNYVGKHISIKQIQRIVARISKPAIGKQIHPHILRHTFATRLMRKTNIRVVQALLGHASISSTQIYTHPNNLDLKAAIEGIS